LDKLASSIIYYLNKNFNIKAIFHGEKDALYYKTILRNHSLATNIMDSKADIVIPLTGELLDLKKLDGTTEYGREGYFVSDRIKDIEKELAIFESNSQKGLNLLMKLTKEQNLELMKKVVNDNAEVTIELLNSILKEQP
jgi:hypothetical protein